MNQDKQTSNSTWPYSSLLLFGYFGKQAPGGRTLALRTTIAFIIFVTGFIAMDLVENKFVEFLLANTTPLAVLIIMWAYKEYLAGLDELSRTIQYKAFAISYGTSMLFAMTLTTMGFFIGTVFLPVWVIFAECVRGIALAVIARGYA